MASITCLSPQVQSDRDTSSYSASPVETNQATSWNDRNDRTSHGDAWGNLAISLVSQRITDICPVIYFEQNPRRVGHRDKQVADPSCLPFHYIYEIKSRPVPPFPYKYSNSCALSGFSLVGIIMYRSRSRVWKVNGVWDRNGEWLHPG